MMNDAPILLLEDDALIAMDLEGELSDRGYHVFCAAKVAQTQAFLDKVTPSFAILDMKLNAEMSFPVAERLLESGVPFVFVSGNDASALPETLRSCQIITKPVQIDVLVAEIEAALAAGPR